MSDVWVVAWHYLNNPRAADCRDEATARQVAEALTAKGSKATIYATEAGA